MSVIITTNEILIYLSLYCIKTPLVWLARGHVSILLRLKYRRYDLFSGALGICFRIIEFGCFSVSKSFVFRKLNFKSVRAVSWLIQAIQAITNATSVSTSQPCRVRYFDQLPSLEFSLSVEAQFNIVQIAGNVKYFQKDERIPISTTKSMTSLL